MTENRHARIHGTIRRMQEGLHPFIMLVIIIVVYTSFMASTVSAASPTVPADEYGQWTIRLTHPVDGATRQAIAQDLGITFQSYMGDNTYRVTGRKHGRGIVRDRHATTQHPFVHKFDPLPDSKKHARVATTLRHHAAHQRRKREEETDERISMRTLLQSSHENPDTVRLRITTFDRKLDGNSWIRTASQLCDLWDTAMPTILRPYNIHAPDDDVIEFLPANDGRTVFAVCGSASVVSIVSTYVSQFPDVEDVEVVTPMSVHNYASRNSLTTGFTPPLYLDFGNTGAIALAWNNNSMWSAGINGNGVIVAVSDTGVDYDNCFFHQTGGVIGNVYSPGKRKVSSYSHRNGTWCLRSGTLPCGDMVDADGHGTHVTGTVGGSSSEDGIVVSTNVLLQESSGIAFNCKIAFTDLQPAGFSGLYTPDPFSNVLIDDLAVGAKIHSASWGCGSGPAACNAYTSYEQALDTYTFENEEFLVLIAAGNDGTLGVEGTVGKPATAKNVMGVGALSKAREKVSYTYLNANPYATFCASPWMSASCCASETVSCPIPACCGTQTCTTDSFLDVRYGLGTPPSRSCHYSVAGNQFFGSQLNPNTRSDDVAIFSSTGPTRMNSGQADGSGLRFQPVIVTLGESIVSANSDGQITNNGGGSPMCDSHPALTSETYPVNTITSIKSGTSMATPGASGAAALIRQYLQEGFYPTGAATGGDEITTISGALLRAILINSAQPLEGSYFLLGNRSNPVHLSSQKWPNKYAGFGAPLLSKVLPLVASNSLFKLHIHDVFHSDSTHALQTGNTRTYTFHGVSISTEFCFTLAWADKGASPLGTQALVNNIDSVATVFDSTDAGNRADGTVFLPNGLTAGTDVHNNVERICIPPVGASTGTTGISVTVTGTAINDVTPFTRQGYAIATTGVWTNALNPGQNVPTTLSPTASPTSSPTTGTPTSVPTAVPTSVPTTGTPTATPTSSPTSSPTTGTPTATPTSSPTSVPTSTPTTGTPTASPTSIPTAPPTTGIPTSSPTANPTAVPTANPTASPTVSPTIAPTATPTSIPTTATPTSIPTANPTAAPTTQVPTLAPTTGTPTLVTISPTTGGPTSSPTTSSPTTASPTAPPTFAGVPIDGNALISNTSLIVSSGGTIVIGQGSSGSNILVFPAGIRITNTNPSGTGDFTLVFDSIDILFTATNTTFVTIQPPAASVTVRFLQITTMGRTFITGSGGNLQIFDSIIRNLNNGTIADIAPGSNSTFNLVNCFVEVGTLFS